MICSNEPGYYKEGEYGIRIENLVVVTEARPVPGGDQQRSFMEFETITLAPIDIDLVEPSLLTEGEARMAEPLSPARLRDAVAGWSTTRPGTGWRT